MRRRFNSAVAYSKIYFTLQVSQFRTLHEMALFNLDEYMMFYNDNKLNNVGDGAVIQSDQTKNKTEPLSGTT